MILVGCCRCMLDVVIGRTAPLRVENNAIVILLSLLKDICCIRSLDHWRHRLRLETGSQARGRGQAWHELRLIQQKLVLHINPRISASRNRGELRLLFSEVGTTDSSD